MGIDFFEGCIKGSVNPKLVSYPEFAVPKVKSPRTISSLQYYVPDDDAADDDDGFYFSFSLNPKPLYNGTSYLTRF